MREWIESGWASSRARSANGLSVALLLLATVTASCGGGDGGQPGLRRFSAQLGSDFHPVAQRGPLQRLYEGLVGGTAYAVSGTMVDAVAAIPLRSGSILDAFTVPVGADGTIRLDLDPSWDWLLLLVNTTAQLDARIVGYVTIGDGESSMLRIPLTAAVDGVDYGTLERAGDEARGTATIEAVQPGFSLTLAELADVALMDDPYKLLMNEWLNTDPDTGATYTFAPEFSWALPLASVEGALDPDAFVFQGYTLSVTSNDTSLDAPGACAGGGSGQRLRLVPPASIETALGTVVTPDAPFTVGGGVPCGDPDFVVNYDGTSGLTLFDAGGGLIRDIPDGPFRIFANDELMAAFEIGVADPNEGGHLRAPVPAPEVVRNAEGWIERVDLTWLIYDPTTGTYVRPSNAALEALVDPLNLNFLFDTGMSAPSYVGNQGTVAAPTANVDASRYRLETPPAGVTDQTQLRGIGVEYRTPGARYRFWWATNFIVDGPDLAVTGVTPIGGLGACPPTFYDVVVQNQGNQALTLDRVLLAGGSVGLSPVDDTPGAADPVTLAPGASTTVRLSYTTTLPVTARQQALIVADPTFAVDERDEFNNEWPVDPVISPAVSGDLGVATVTLTPNPASTGQAVTVTVDVVNNGGFDAYVCAGHPLWTAAVPGAGNVSHRLTEAVTVPVGGTVSRTETLIASVALSPASYTVPVRVDPDGTAIDTNASNDVLSTSLVVQ